MKPSLETASPAAHDQIRGDQAKISAPTIQLKKSRCVQIALVVSSIFMLAMAIFICLQIMNNNDRLVEENKRLNKAISEAGPPVAEHLSTVCGEMEKNDNIKCKIFSQAQNPPSQRAILKRLKELDDKSPWYYRQKRPDCDNNLCYYGYWEKHAEPSPPEDSVIMGGPY